jgi:hypothetical protein
VPEDDRPTDETDVGALRKDWDPEFGDRRQEIVFIGCELDEAAIRADLDACLLDDDELRVGPDGWAFFPDPFDPWESAEDAGDEHDGDADPPAAEAAADGGR